MKSFPAPFSCECCDPITRRNFLKTTVTGVAAAATATLPFGSVTEAADNAKAAKIKSTKPETLVAALYKSLTEEQSKVIAFPFHHPLRSKVDNNWQITDKKVSEFFTRDQQAMIKEIFLGLHSPEYAERVLKQVEHDSGKEGFGGCSIAMFGE